ncbi:hypothetical protein PGB90_000957 [Kerria lacca]
MKQEKKLIENLKIIIDSIESQPWVGVFDHGEMDGFLVNNIVPKLQNVLQDFIINPRQQCLENWNWVMEWSEMIPAHTMASILDRFFFPKWLQNLSVWLNTNFDFNEVGKWFSGSKTIIPDNIKTQSLIIDHLRRALELMNKAAIEVIGSGPLSERPLRSEEPIEVIRIMEPPVSLKSMVQSRCEERGILWISISNCFMEAKQQSDSLQGSAQLARDMLVSTYISTNGSRTAYKLF